MRGGVGILMQRLRQTTIDEYKFRMTALWNLMVQWPSFGLQENNNHWSGCSFYILFRLKFEIVRC